MTTPTNSSQAGLRPDLKNRHVTMIAMGGIIGAGLFVGSGAVLSSTGPSSFLTYFLSGLIVVCAMRMLGEMAVAHPSTGSFVEYSRKALGDWAGFSSGWLYWYVWVIVVGFEAVAGAGILQYWIDLPLWVLSLILLAGLTLSNLTSVRSFGEFEFWFAGIKVVAILAFIALGAAFVLGLWPGRSLDFGNLTAHGGFFPNGPQAMLSTVVVVMFAMMGPEIATIAAAESKDPARSVSKATNSVILRIITFYVGSVFLLAVIVPWSSVKSGQSPFVAAMNVMGIPGADSVMNGLILVAVLSCLNSAIFTASRMLFVLAGKNEAPAALVKVNKRGVPAPAILASTLVGFLSVIAAAVSPDTVFLFLLNSSGALILFVYLLMCVSQIVLRMRNPKADLPLRMWLFPWLSLLTTAAIVAVLVLLGVREDTRSQLWLGLGTWALTLVVFGIRRVRTSRAGRPVGARQDELAGS
ncbi:amino acid permease [Nonomuraea sp. NPDC050786]|uniref:amino acid permease n=1 Tax=Nonomuraea sp. NPDC050786 TaxID=3154840 RepID=UPI0033E74996